MLLETEFKIEEAVAVAKEEGKEEGREEGFLQAAKKMLKKGIAPALVADITGFPLKQIKALR